MSKKVSTSLFHGDCLDALSTFRSDRNHLTFLDPPFNQNKIYCDHDDKLPERIYWSWMEDVLSEVYRVTSPGGVIYFMQREKNLFNMNASLIKTGWAYQNTIIWVKMAANPPGNNPCKYGKTYQVIGYYSKNKPEVYNLLRIVNPHNPNWKVESPSRYLGDVWTGIREMTAGFYAGKERLLGDDGKIIHKQQSPLGLLLRILLVSTLPGDWILDPFAGTGTTLVVARQLGRNSIGVDNDFDYCELAAKRLNSLRKVDDVSNFRDLYEPTNYLEEIWQP